MVTQDLSSTTPATQTPKPETSDLDTPPEHRSRALISWLWRNYLRKHLKLLAVAMTFMVIEGSMLGALSYMMQPMFDRVFVNGEIEALWWVGVVILLIFVLRAVAGVTQRVLLTRISQLTAADIRTDMLDRLMQQDTAFHQEHPPGYLIQRVQSDVNAINQVWRSIITGAGRDTIGLFILMGVALSTDWKWALLAIVGTPLLVLPATFFYRFVRTQARQARDLGADLATRLDEVFHGIIPIKLNALETYQSQRFAGLTDRFVRSEVRAALGGAAIPGMIDIMAGVGFMAVLFYGGSEIIAGEKTVGQFMTFFTAMAFAFDPLRRLGALSGVWQMAAASIERIKELLEAPVRLKTPETPVPTPQCVPDIALENVSLSYGDAQVLRGISLFAKAGQTTALVGPSGTGKSTVFNLLTRLVDPQEGRVLIGGVPATEMALTELRGLFSVVSQDALLFDETLRENILLDRKDVSDAQLKAALDAAHVQDFVESLPDGLETRVGPRGSALSGGQRQRVAIARALLRDTPILLLDEATSALDAQAEAVVQQALERLSQGRTTLVIAHRLSTIRGADKIIVMDGGQVVDEGRHEELIARDGIYADLYRLQFQKGKEVVDADGQSALTPKARKIPALRAPWYARLTSMLR